MFVVTWLKQRKERNKKRLATFPAHISDLCLNTSVLAVLFGSLPLTIETFPMLASNLLGPEQHGAKIFYVLPL